MVVVCGTNLKLIRGTVRCAVAVLSRTGLTHNGRRHQVLGRSDVKEHGAQVLRGEQGIPLRRNSQSSK